MAEIVLEKLTATNVLFLFKITLRNCYYPVYYTVILVNFRLSVKIWKRNVKLHYCIRYCLGPSTNGPIKQPKNYLSIFLRQENPKTNSL